MTWSHDHSVSCIFCQNPAKLSCLSCKSINWGWEVCITDAMCSWKLDYENFIHEKFVLSRIRQNHKIFTPWKFRLYSICTCTGFWHGTSLLGDVSLPLKFTMYIHVCVCVCRCCVCECVCKTQSCCLFLCWCCIAGSFHQEEIFAYFTTWSCWRKFCSVIFFFFFFALC